jgi:hypothetical protein
MNFSAVPTTRPKTLPFQPRMTSLAAAGWNPLSYRTAADMRARGHISCHYRRGSVPGGRALPRATQPTPPSPARPPWRPRSPACDAAYAAFSCVTSPAAALDAAPFAVTPANVLRFYACEDGSVWKSVVTCTRAFFDALTAQAADGCEARGFYTRDAFLAAAGYYQVRARSGSRSPTSDAPRFNTSRCQRSG